MKIIREQEPEGFPEFWNVWRPCMRRTDGRRDARDAYRKHILAGASPEDILDGAKAFLRDMPERDKPYIPLAASWLNKESYLDWADKEREYQARLAARAENVVQMKPLSNYKPKFLQDWESQKREG
jgi:hypothetical protein